MSERSTKEENYKTDIENNNSNKENSNQPVLQEIIIHT